MHYLVYTSTASLPLTEAELGRLLVRWRVNNARWGVTGVLLYSEGHIMQVLEGDAETVHALFGTIETDIRHRGVTKLADGPVPERAFADWSMRFRTMDSADYNRFVHRMKAAPNHASSLAPLLEVFMDLEAS
ncbi:BLUF domain-containing protein [Hymenobacter sp. BT770]|uniref:BLUF domain-containing protein n=1 Tax=Hymenobacter sp. BT770 TaxID=2886942 RepID=UPI001D1000F4|nr:BLUF domain-containing protein [Hymenobacter sp. BT770]MCC3151981.1 BLUF domain-containing protein [Hymenobacter sp. BT770]MDO3417091.1 BLUF domain-containing protein [Hymenobacter sp. BT770]